MRIEGDKVYMTDHEHRLLTALAAVERQLTDPGTPKWKALSNTLTRGATAVGEEWELSLQDAAILDLVAHEALGDPLPDYGQTRKI